MKKEQGITEAGGGGWGEPLVLVRAFQRRRPTELFICIERDK